MAQSQIDIWWHKNKMRVMWAAVLYLYTSNETIKSQNKEYKEIITSLIRNVDSLKQNTSNGYHIADRQMLRADSIERSYHYRDSVKHMADSAEDKDKSALHKLLIR